MYACIKEFTIYECNEYYLANALSGDTFTNSGYNLAILHLKTAIISGVLCTIPTLVWLGSNIGRAIALSENRTEQKISWQDISFQGSIEYPFQMERLGNVLQCIHVSRLLGESVFFKIAG